MKSIRCKFRGIRACTVLLVSTALAFPAGVQAQSEPNTGSPEYLHAFPSPEKVRADIVAGAGDARPEEIEGRVEGRLRTLANALEHSPALKICICSTAGTASSERTSAPAFMRRQPPAEAVDTFIRAAAIFRRRRRRSLHRTTRPCSSVRMMATSCK